MIGLAKSKISIHAPTRGATGAGLSMPMLHRNFNPRSHERSDSSGISPCVYRSTFQSTLPREERQRLDRLVFSVRLISIHAPTRGATDVSERVIKLLIISIHAPTRGATVPGCLCPCYTGISIHAPTRGAT